MRVNAITSKLIGNIPQRNIRYQNSAYQKIGKAGDGNYAKNKEVSFKAYYYYPINMDDKTGDQYEHFNSYIISDKYLEEDSEAILKRLKEEYEETKKTHDNNNYQGWRVESITTGRRVSYTGFSREHSTAHLLAQLGYLISGGRSDLVAPYYEYATSYNKTVEEVLNDPKNQNIDIEKYMKNFKKILCKDAGHSKCYMEIDTRSKAFSNIFEKAKTNIKKFIEEKLKEGNIGELRSKYPQYEKVIDETLEEMGLNKFGEYKKDVKIQYPTLMSQDDFTAKNDEINNSIKERKKFIKDLAKIGMLSGDDRAEVDFLTLGLYELYRAGAIYIKTLEPIRELKEDIASKRKALADEALQQTEKYEKSIKGVEEGVKKLQALQDKEEKIKEVLTEGLVNKINALYQGVPVRNMPNCVMFEGENPYKAQELSNWVHYAADTYYDAISSNADKDTMKQNIYTRLEKAEENYKETGKRTIIFVEGMDKLLIENENSNETIAWMKLIMQCASEKYHSTIMFFGANPDKYATGINTRGRIGLKVPVNISIEEANVQNMFKF